MLYRKSPRDLFDVYRIAGASFDMRIFRQTAVMDSLFRGLPSLLDINYCETISGIRFDSSLLNVLYRGNTFDEEHVHETVIEFSADVLGGLSVDEVQLIKTFYSEHRLDEDLISKMIKVHSGIVNHPLIKWQIKELLKQ
jgi:hypothetical protein